MPNTFGDLRIKHLSCLSILSIVLFLTGCASTTPQGKEKPVPEQRDRVTINQLGKSDFDRMADVEMRENTESLKALMVKLYKRNPKELKKTTSSPLEKMVDWVFDGNHNWQFESIQNKQELDAIFLSFNPEYDGDRVLPFIVGLQTMLIKAHGGKTEFYLQDTIDPQKIYNAARNVEIAAWKLSNARDANGQLYLLTNEINEKERNLSFEREFGKIVGRTDLFAVALAEKSQRFITRVIQNLATAAFLPF